MAHYSTDSCISLATYRLPSWSLDPTRFGKEQGFPMRPAAGCPSSPRSSNVRSSTRKPKPLADYPNVRSASYGCAADYGLEVCALRSVNTEGRLHHDRLAQDVQHFTATQTCVVLLLLSISRGCLGMFFSSFSPIARSCQVANSSPHS